MAEIEETLSYVIKPSTRTWRMIKDRLFAATMAIGGIAVIIAILLIFLYLFYVVIPLFKSAEITPLATYQAPQANQIEHLAIDEYAEIGLRIGDDANYEFFRLNSGTVFHHGRLVRATDAPVRFVTAAHPASGVIAIALADGTAIVARIGYDISYPNDTRKSTPKFTYPLGREAHTVSFENEVVSLLAVEHNEEMTTFAAWTPSGRLVLTRIAVEESFLDDEITMVHRQTVVLPNIANIVHIAMDAEQAQVYLASADGTIAYYDIRNIDAPKLIDLVAVVEDGVAITALEFLSGGISLMVGDSRGRISQWFPVRNEHSEHTLERIRVFELVAGTPITAVAPEYFRKGFAAADAAGRLALFHTTANRRVLTTRIGQRSVRKLVASPRGDGLLALSDNGQLQVLHVDNEHPEVSFASLWRSVWYESRQEPKFLWQSSSSSNDFEPKYSLMPLTFGTFKAAFYAMLFAMPLAIFGAMYTAYFMDARLCRIVKPSIELMQALPTVILGFLAGLWLAPLVEQRLLGIFLVFLAVPPACLISAYGFHRLPPKFRPRLLEGWEALLLIPIIILTIASCMSISPVLEVIWFDGNLPQWLTINAGISFDQRNSLVVGIAMGFAVIPTIFSISEDAIFSVPRHLTMGSLALGATPWQTMIRVVLLTASPGIFSAVMIGLGRAVGETMIVLMATGNTPIMDINIFEGFRALSANIAVEMPEAEVNSSHYRILFLAALVLFLVTFMFNTVAEVVRQRLRVKYSNL